MTATFSSSMCSYPDFPGHALMLCCPCIWIMHTLLCKSSHTMLDHTSPEGLVSNPFCFQTRLSAVLCLQPFVQPDLACNPLSTLLAASCLTTGATTASCFQKLSLRLLTSVYILQASNAAMAVFSPLDTNVIPGFQYNSSATPPSSFPQGGARAALASWSKKPAEQTANTPIATLSGILACHVEEGHGKAAQLSVCQSILPANVALNAAHTTKPCNMRYSTKPVMPVETGPTELLIMTLACLWLHMVV